MASAWGKSWGNAWGVSWGLVSDAAHETVKSGVNRLWATMLQEQADAPVVDAQTPPAVVETEKRPLPRKKAKKQPNHESAPLPAREPSRPPVKLRPMFVVEQRPEPFVSEDSWGIIFQTQPNVRLLQKVFEARAEKKRRQREDEDLLLLLAA